MNRIELYVEPTSCRDHQVRIRVDGGEWHGGACLGIDPPEFFAQSFQGGPLLVGRCGCGCVGCSDLWMETLRDGQEMVWKEAGLRFDYAQYMAEVERAALDHSWEDRERRVERLVGEVLSGSSLPDGLPFQWASARIQSGMLKLSYGDETQQRLIDLPWTSDEDAVRLARARL